MKRQPFCFWTIKNACIFFACVRRFFIKSKVMHVYLMKTTIKTAVLMKTSINVLNINETADLMQQVQEWFDNRTPQAVKPSTSTALPSGPANIVSYVHQSWMNVDYHDFKCLWYVNLTYLLHKHQWNFHYRSLVEAFAPCLVGLAIQSMQDVVSARWSCLTPKRSV